MKTRFNSFLYCKWAGCLLLMVGLCAPQRARAQDADRSSPGDSAHVQPDMEPAASTEERATGPAALVSRVGVLADRAVMAAGRMGDPERSYYEVNFQPFIWYNRVDGLHLGLDRIVESSRYSTVGGGAGWNSSLSGRDRWTWHAMAQLHSVGRTSVFVRGQYEARTARRYGESSYVSAIANGLVMVLGGDDYFDYYRSEGFRGTAGVNFGAVKSRLSGSFRSERHSVLPLTTSYDFFRALPLRSNPAIEEGRMQSVSVDLVIGTEEDSEEASARSLTLQAETSVAGSDYAFRRYRADARWKQVTHCRTCKRPGQLLLRLTAGTSTGSLPMQRAFVIDNSVSIFSVFGAMRSVTGPPLEGERMVAFFWEYEFGSTGLKALGLRSLFGSSIGLAAFGGHTTGSWDSAAPANMGGKLNGRRLLAGAYHELGLSLILGDARVYFAQPLEGGNIVVRLGLVRSL